MPERSDDAPQRSHDPEEVLRLEDVNAFYGESHVLHGVDLGVRQGEVVTLLGRNGAGKTTTLKSIMGILAQRTGSIRFDGRELVGLPSNKVAKLGLAYCPEERGIFASLDVEENLLLPPVVRQGGMALDEVYRLFPNLQERRRSQGTRLSGGEQQMLAIARILRTGATLLLLDEPTEGLAPVIMQQIGNVIRQLKGRGYTVADRHYLMEHGRIVDMFENDKLDANMAKLHEYLGV
jgi:branched-chain amino acid transport system ATP-binding protein